MNSGEESNHSAQLSPGDSGDSPQPPQSTYTRTSCDLCKRMKIKCERQGESCVHCIARGAKCDMTFVKRKKQAKRSNIALQDVESRIKRLESVLTASGIDPAQFDESESTTEKEKEWEKEKEKEDVAAEVSDNLSTLFISRSGTSRFIGPSSGFSLFSPQGLQWIADRTGTNEVAHFVQTLTKAKDNPFPVTYSTDLFHTMSAEEREPLPPKETADVFVDCFFNTFNHVFPLLDQQVFLESYELQYSGMPVEGAAWYSILNVVICLGSMLFHAHRQDNPGPSCILINESSEKRIWKYFRNACSCFTDLMFHDCNLMAVQALCGMAFIQQATLDPQPYYILTAAAGRLAYSIGIHRKLDHFGLSQSEINQRRNVFWIVYIMDKSIALRVGHPSVMIDEDIGVALPQPRDMPEKTPNSPKRFDKFRWQAELALIESRIYSELYSVRGRSRPELERLKSVGRLDKELLEWREKVPIEIRPEEPIICTREQFVPVIMMQFGYLNCMLTIHRVSNNGSWTNNRERKDWFNPNKGQLNSRVYASHSICLSTARTMIKLLQNLDRMGDSPRDYVMWMALYFPLSGFLTLFANLLQNPQDPYIASDMKLMKSAISFVQPKGGRLTIFSTSSVIQIFAELGDVAEKFLAKVNALGAKREKRVYDPQQNDQNAVSNESEMVNSLGDARFNTLATTSTMIPDNSPDMTSTANQSSIQPFKMAPQQDVDYQTQLPLIDGFEMGIPGLGPNDLSLHVGEMDLSNWMPGAPVFPEPFEWDLANLWHTDYPQNM